MKKLSRDQICMLTLFFALDPIPHTPTTVTIPSVDCCENPALYVIVGWVSMVIKGGDFHLSPFRQRRHDGDGGENTGYYQDKHTCAGCW